MASRLRAHLSYANVVSSVCLFIVLGGSAYAATVITGKNVRNGSLTGKDVKNKSLTPRDFRGSVRGPKGDTGPPGPKGDTGQQGPTGPPGSGSNADTLDGLDSSQFQRVGLVQAGAADQTEDEGFAFVLPPWDELAHITTDGDADSDFTVRILNTGSQSITVRHPNGQSTLGPGFFTVVSVGTLPSILIRSADGARSWLVTCGDDFGTQIMCHGVRNRLG